MEYILTMTFLSINGKKTSLTLEGVKNTITDSEVNALMDIIISNDIFVNNDGALVEKSSASLTQIKII